jgi:RHS repeat-associated protein
MPLDQPDRLQGEVRSAVVVQTPELLFHDLDRNLVRDGRWVYSWDAENRLVRVMSWGSVDRRRVDWRYDAMGRRVRQVRYVWTNSTWQVVEDLKLVSDPGLFGRHIAELNGTNGAVVRSYVWGLDVSETLDGAGGVGGLLWVRLSGGPGAGVHFVTYDGNGNVWTLVSASTGTETGRYEYGPFGEPLRLTGAAAGSNPIRFSTKRTEDGTGLVLYEYRAYSPTLGRWLSRDPLGEPGFTLIFESSKTDEEVGTLGAQILNASLRTIQRNKSAMLDKRYEVGSFHPRPNRAHLAHYDFVNQDPINQVDFLGLKAATGNKDDKSKKDDQACKSCCANRPNPVKDLFRTAADTLAAAIASADDWPPETVKQAAQMIRIFILISQAKEGCDKMKEAAELFLTFARSPEQDSCYICCQQIKCSFPHIVGGIGYFSCHSICAAF